jgi:hypothetical protein
MFLDQPDDRFGLFLRQAEARAELAGDAAPAIEWSSWRPLATSCSSTAT